MSYLTDTEKRLLFSALRREKEVCKKIDDAKVEDATCKMLVPVVESIERKFYYDRFEKEIRNKVIEKFAEKVKTSSHAYLWCCKDLSLEFCSMDDCEACMDKFKKQIDEIAEQMKEEEQKAEFPKENIREFDTEKSEQRITQQQIYFPFS